jgi:addiction module HigA family antidote
MRPSARIPTHPGEILLEEFLIPSGLTQVDLAQHLGVPVQRINGIVRGKRSVTPDTAWLLAAAFGTTPGFWINLQSAHDLALARPAVSVGRILRPKPRRASPARSHRTTGD